ncbi:MAG: arginine deiminase family protein [Ferroplasma sp.]
MKIRAEWDTLRNVIMHRPGPEITYAMLAPKPFLFERPFNYTTAIAEHELLEDTLRQNGVHVDILGKLIVDKAESNKGFRAQLENNVMSLANFYGTQETVIEAKKSLTKNIEYIDAYSLFQLLILEPSIDLKEYMEGVQYPRVYSNLPLANLYFMRDQQAIADGVLIGNMRMRQRRKETEVTSFVFSELFNNSVKRIENGFFEGGDFMPAGDMCLIGTGNRTDEAGAMSAMESGAINFDRVVIVTNPQYSFMDGKDIMVNMHLDTYFNIAADGTAVTSVELAKKAAVNVYSRNNGKYGMDYKTTLYDLLMQEGWNIINLGISEQLSYSSNFLTISENRIVAIDSIKIIKKLIAENVFDASTKNAILKDIEIKNGAIFPQSKEIRDSGIDIIKLDLSEITGGYGGAHCMTATIDRN